jgi:hypothetical protein
VKYIGPTLAKSFHLLEELKCNLMFLKCIDQRVLTCVVLSVGLIINTCAVVHNIGVHYRVPNPQPMFDPIDYPAQGVAVLDVLGPQLQGHQVHAAGQAVRARVVHDHFTL